MAQEFSTDSTSWRIAPRPSTPESSNAPSIVEAVPRNVEVDVYTDWYIPEDDVEQALIYPGPIKVTRKLLPIVTRMLELAKSACYVKDDAGLLLDIRNDYRIKYADSYFRGHRQHTVDGVLHILRATAKYVPESKTLGLPAAVRSLLTSQILGDIGGLVIVCGQPGHGKSTTCAAILHERVRTFGSFCLTVEDPPEFPLSGEYPCANDPGKVGRIIQVPAGSKSFASDLRDALRCYPSNSRGSMLLVGEVRDVDSAAQVLQAAANGLLVFITTHAGDSIMAIERLLSLARSGLADPREAAGILSSVLRVVLHQRLQNGKLSVSPLFSMAADSPVAAVLRNNDPRQLASEVSQQQIMMAKGTLESHILQNSRSTPPNL